MKKFIHFWVLKCRLLYTKPTHLKEKWWNHVCFFTSKPILVFSTTGYKNTWTRETSENPVEQIYRKSKIFGELLLHWTDHSTGDSMTFEFFVLWNPRVDLSFSFKQVSLETLNQPSKHQRNCSDEGMVLFRRRVHVPKLNHTPTCCPPTCCFADVFYAEMGFILRVLHLALQRAYVTGG